MGIRVISEKCNGCKLCIKSCPYSAIEIVEKIAAIGDNCNLCGACVEACPEGAILITRGKSEKKVPEGYRGVWIFAEQRDGKVASVVYELLGFTHIHKLVSRRPNVPFYMSQKALRE